MGREVMPINTIATAGIKKNILFIREVLYYFLL
jgi:hypothetical protein